MSTQKCIQAWCTSSNIIIPLSAYKYTANYLANTFNGASGNQTYWTVIKRNENAWVLTHLLRHTFLKSFCQNDVILWRHMTAWRQHVASQEVLTSHDRPGFVSCLSNQKKVSRITRSHFLTWWPWPLTYDLDNQTWPRYGAGRPPCQISCLYVQQFSR